jgi:hydrogenase maturation protein HypF
MQGRVQGVGFRPFIYREATKRKLEGWVSNTKDGAHIEILAPNSGAVKEFCDNIRENCPKQARIERMDIREVPFQQTGPFYIRHSEQSGPASLSLTPDFAICGDCKEELFDRDNRRFNYPFITCTNCGPRFSIIRHIPYDRVVTTMEKFEMCPSCSKEYSNPLDRRFYSQTNSCPDCPVELALFDSNGESIAIDQAEIVPFVSNAILEGKIMAVKGIGGFLLLVDATSETAVRRLRERKKRPTKPFALMYPDIAMAEKDVHSSPSIEEMWESPESPIILCLAREGTGRDVKKELIAPGLNRLGIMLPYAPLFLLIMKRVNKPLVATSGNITESPIIYKDREALESLAGIADYVLANNREIVVPQDDSVIQYTPFQQRKIIVRRSRGLAPAFNELKPLGKFNESMLAMGAMLKSTFGIYHRDRFYISQYLGNTESLESQQNYEQVLDHVSRVLDFRPERILVDMHPDYPSTFLGEKRSAEMGIPLKTVQHHEAHAFAVLGENELLDNDRILCVIWDGTGLGYDRQIWGGEFLIYEDKKFSRTGHFSYYNHFSGDKMALEPRLSLLSLLSDNPDTSDVLKDKFNDSDLTNYRRIGKNNLLKTSSAGRLFDAIASLLDISDFNYYEGESAMNLEAEANEMYLENPDYHDFYELSFMRDEIVDLPGLIDRIVSDKRGGSLTRREIALKFHVTLVKIIEMYAERHHLRHIAFSGGVFQNALLIDLICRDMMDKFKLYFHKELSPNDECISYGQMISYYVSRRKLEPVSSINQKLYKQ